MSEENTTMLGALSAMAMAAAIAGPVISFAIGQITSDRNGIPSFKPIVFNIVPINNEAKSPIAIEPKTSIP